MLRKFNIAALIILSVVITYEYLAPIFAAEAYGDNYKTLMFACDHAMRDHYIAKKSVELTPTPETMKNLEAADLGLLSCHEYDKMRKRLQALNVSDNKLERLGLEALEEQKYDLQRFVKSHEFRY